VKYFNLFSNIVITKGAKRLLVSDLQRNKSELFPLELYDVIEELKNNSIDFIINELYIDDESKDIFKEYLDILLENDFGFLSENDWDKNFPELSTEFSVPNEITNAFLEISDIETLKIIKDSLINLGTEHIVIYHNDCLNIKKIESIENIFQKTPIKSIEIFSVYSDEIDEVFLKNMDNLSMRIHHLVFYNCRNIPFRVKDIYKFKVNFTKQNIKLNSCGKIDLKYFNTNLPKVLEAMNYNSCLHKKIAVDVGGNIKNCPCMPQSYGNINEVTLENALCRTDLKKYWMLTKDNIEVCRDCEFRYICTDCRAYTEQTHFNKNGLDISKPLKCGYNPYRGEWEDWSTNPLKQKAMQSYEL
jgi:SPASM domain peptide maturase of grasp-with-spasm system